MEVLRVRRFGPQDTRGVPSGRTAVSPRRTGAGASRDHPAGGQMPRDGRPWARDPSHATPPPDHSGHPRRARTGRGRARSRGGHGVPGRVHGLPQLHGDRGGDGGRGGRPPGHRAALLDREELPGPRPVGDEDLGQRRDRRERARGPVRRLAPRRRAHGRGDDAADHALAGRWLRVGHPDHEHRERTRGLDRLPGQPGRRRVRHLGGKFHFWRKNRQPTPGTGYIGTDLNRNYGYRWGGGGNTSSNPAAITYRGPSAFSAPEDAGDARLPGQPGGRRQAADPGRRSRSTSTAGW